MSPIVSNNSNNNSIAMKNLPAPVHEDFDAAFRPEEMRPLALVCHDTKKAELREFVAKYKNVLKKFRLTGTQATLQSIQEIYGESQEVAFVRSGPYELIDSMKNGEIGGAIFFRDEKSPNLLVEALVRQAVVNNLLSATTPTTAASIVEILRGALAGKGKPQLLPTFFLALRKNPAVDAYEQRMKNAMKKANQRSRATAAGKKMNNKNSSSKAATDALRVPHAIQIRHASPISARSA